jgi:predicted lipoprotein
MSAPTAPSARRATAGSRPLIFGAAAVILVVAMALNVKVVKLGSEAAAPPGAFNPEAYGQSTFPKVQAEIEKRAVDAATLATALAQNADDAAKKYGVPATIGTEYSVKFTGVAGKGNYGVYFVKIPGVPDAVTVRVQMGPAINGTAVRDATGTITFGQFTNQIDYQNAGSALNNEIKKQVLSKIDAKALSGKTITVVGAFQYVVPNSWLITPVKVEVQ